MYKINSMEWHESHLRNMKNYYKRLRKEQEKREEYAKRIKNDISMLEYQIKEAKKIGKDKFDKDRFRIKKVKINEKIR